MTINKVVALLIALIVLSTAIIIRQSFSVRNLKDELGITVRDLRKKDKQLEFRGDSIKILVRKNADLDTLWSGIVRDQLAAIEQERAKTNKVTRQYEKLKNTSPVHYSEQQLDSIVRTILQRRQH